MSLVQDARELASIKTETLTASGTTVCAVCFHAGCEPGCPALSRPRIVEALEAAQALVARGPENPYHDCHGCGQVHPGTWGHREGCPWQALAMALEQTA